MSDCFLCAWGCEVPAGFGGDVGLSFDADSDRNSCFLVERGFYSCVFM